MKKWFGIGMLLLLLTAVMGCSAGGNEEQNGIQVYYVNREETAIVPVEYVLTAEERTEVIKELLQLLKTDPEDNNLKATIPSGIEMNGCRINEDKLYIDFTQTYKEMLPTKEILVRAAIVRTMMQVEGLLAVEFELDGEPMMDPAGVLIGSMTAAQFIDNEGTEISTYEEVTLRLYFANAEGTQLVPVSRQVEYNTNVSLEKLVMEQLILGSSEQNAYPTINPATKVINVTVNDGTCYVNLDQTFLTQVYSVNSEVTIYSIVNSLVELENVNKVQILVNGQNEISYRESVNLNTTFGRNLDLIQEEVPREE